MTTTPIELGISLRCLYPIPSQYDARQKEFQNAKQVIETVKKLHDKVMEKPQETIAQFQNLYAGEYLFSALTVYSPMVSGIIDPLIFDILDKAAAIDQSSVMQFKHILENFKSPIGHPKFLARRQSVLDALNKPIEINWASISKWSDMLEGMQFDFGMPDDTIACWLQHATTMIPTMLENENKHANYYRIYSLFVHHKSDIVSLAVEFITNVAQSSNGVAKLSLIAPKGCVPCITLNMLLTLNKHPKCQSKVFKFFQSYASVHDSMKIKEMAYELSKYHVQRHVAQSLYRTDCPPICISIHENEKVTNFLQSLPK